MNLPQSVKIIEGADFRDCSAVGSMGLVNNVAYISCLWPRLDMPTALFSDGSDGIYVQGPPTPRNVLFPADTVALPARANRAGYGELPRYEDLDCPTRLDVFFIRDFKAQTVIEEVERTKTLEVEPGVFAEVKYMGQVESEQVLKSYVVENIKRADAEQVAGAVAEMIAKGGSV